MASLSKISEILVGHPAVRRAGATTVPHGGRRLVVAVAELNQYCGGPMLRDYVLERLDTEDELAGVLTVDSLPTVDGALDAEWTASAVADGRCALFEGPGDEVERRLAGIWADAMDVRSVGVHDDFLELGGDSLSALEIISTIETEFERSLDVYEFMNASSVRKLASVLRDDAAQCGPDA